MIAEGEVIAADFAYSSYAISNDWKAGLDNRDRNEEERNKTKPCLPAAEYGRKMGRSRTLKEWVPKKQTHRLSRRIGGDQHLSRMNEPSLQSITRVSLRAPRPMPPIACSPGSAGADTPCRLQTWEAL